MDKKQVAELLIGLLSENKTEPTYREVSPNGGQWRIVVLQRGWIFVGKYYEDGEYIVLENASNVEKWGTEEGLGELADKGELSETRLRACKDEVRYHKLTEVFSILCNQQNWS